jgi:hypothetical protein
MDRRRKFCLSIVVLAVWSSDSLRRRRCRDSVVRGLLFVAVAVNCLEAKNYGCISDLIASSAICRYRPCLKHCTTFVYLAFQL